jgi:hypothetical protein
VRVFSTARDSTSITSVVSNQSGKQIKVAGGHLRRVGLGGGGGGQTCCFWKKKFPGKKGAVRRCVVMMQQPVVLLPKFGAKSSHIFIQSP